jgi:PPOX class probable F420-dependent enzyme
MFSDAELAFIERHRLGHLATADAIGAPHVVPVCFAVVGNCIYFVVDDKPKHTRLGLKRLRNIAANPRVALVIDDYDEDWSRLAYLLVHGTAAIVEDAEEWIAAVMGLRRRYRQYHSMDLAPATHPVVRIVVDRWHFWQSAPGRGGSGG